MSLNEKDQIRGLPIANTKAPVRLTVGLGEGQALFERALPQCRLGERSEFRLGSDDQDFLNTLVWTELDEILEHPIELKNRPQDFYIKLEVEICGVRTPKHREEKNVFELTTEEKRTRAEDLKKKADGEFKNQNFQAAADLYTKGYKLVFFEDGEVFNDLKFRIASNLAFMNLKLKRYEDCINMNDQLIKFGYKVTDKTFFRNGQAAEAYGRLEEAIKYYERAIAVSKDEEYKASVENNIVVVKKKIVDKKDQVRRNMQRMWNS